MAAAQKLVATPVLCWHQPAAAEPVVNEITRNDAPVPRVFFAHLRFCSLCWRVRSNSSCEHIGNGETDMNNLKELVFYWSVCHVCKSYRETELLKQCQGCKMIYYCSREHQKEHWPMHKRICNAINKLLHLKGGAGLFHEVHQYCTLDEWCNIRTKNIILTELMIQRKFVSSEKQMFMFPRVCEVCKREACRDFTDCQKCRCVTYCSKDHQEVDASIHKDKCHALYLCFQLDLFMCNISSTYFVSDMSKFMEMNMNIPKNMGEFLLSGTKKLHACTGQENQIYYSELLTCPLTLLYALSHTAKYYNDTLIVHLVGASSLECRSIWEILFHFLPNVCKLHLVLVGPEIETIQSCDKLCEKCCESSREIYLEHQCYHYHTYIESKEYNTPDVISVFNCGFNENEGTDNDTWLPSFPYFLKFKNVPIIITSYTKSEAERDIQRFVNCHKEDLSIPMNCTHNPFSSNWPHRDWASLRADVFYNNYYLSLIKMNGIN